MHVLGRDAFRAAVLRAEPTLLESQRGPGTPGRAGDRVPGGRGDGNGRQTPSDVRRRFLRAARRPPRRTTLGGQRRGSVAYQTPTDQRRRLRAHRFVRHPDGHVAVQSQRDDVVRHLLSSVRCHGSRFQAVDIYLHVADTVFAQILCDRRDGAQNDQRGESIRPIITPMYRTLYAYILYTHDLGGGGKGRTTKYERMITGWALTF